MFPSPPELLVQVFVDVRFSSHFCLLLTLSSFLHTREPVGILSFLMFFVTGTPLTDVRVLFLLCACPPPAGGDALRCFAVS